MTNQKLSYNNIADIDFILLQRNRHFNNVHNAVESTLITPAIDSEFIFSFDTL